MKNKKNLHNCTICHATALEYGDAYCPNCGSAQEDQVIIPVSIPTEEYNVLQKISESQNKSPAHVLAGSWNTLMHKFLLETTLGGEDLSDTGTIE